MTPLPRSEPAGSAPVVILGAGLAGLSTAYHLRNRPYLILEAHASAGGLCRSRSIRGFTFDYTGHLLHVRDQRTRLLLDHLLPDAFVTIRRDARIRTQGVTLPFPFQAHLHGLPQQTVAKCIVDFVQRMIHGTAADPLGSFLEWSRSTFGDSISDAFLLPYTTKVFARSPAELTADWVSWSVPRPSLEQVVKGALGVPTEALGYNATFLYPKTDGITILASAIARHTPSMRFATRPLSIDVDRRLVYLSPTEHVRYSDLVSTIPLPALLRLLEGGHCAWRDLAQDLDWSVVACLNLGVARDRIADGAHWIYFPDPDVPFYRVGFPTNVSTRVAPPGHSSMYVEFGLQRNAPFDPERLASLALDSLRREGVLSSSDDLVLQDWVTIDPAYVVFNARRREVLAALLPALASHGIHLVGRFGAWTYSYMERALLDGMELASQIDQ